MKKLLILLSLIFVVQAQAAITIVLNSIASMTNTVGQTGVDLSAIVRGFSTSTDGGGGIFIYDHNSTQTPDGGTCFAPLGGIGRWIRQNLGSQGNSILWFGAKGGTNDDTIITFNAVKNLISAGFKKPNIWFPPTTNYTINLDGIYSLTNTFYMHGDGSFINTTNQALFGGTVLYSGDPSKAVFNVANDVRRVDGAIIEGFVFPGTSSNNTGIEVKFSGGAYYCKIKDCWFTGYTNAVIFDGGTNQDMGYNAILDCVAIPPHNNNSSVTYYTRTAWTGTKYNLPEYITGGRISAAGSGQGIPLVVDGSQLTLNAGSAGYIDYNYLCALEVYGSPTNAAITNVSYIQPSIAWGNMRIDGQNITNVIVQYPNTNSYYHVGQVLRDGIFNSGGITHYYDQSSAWTDDETVGSDFPVQNPVFRNPTMVGFVNLSDSAANPGLGIVNSNTISALGGSLINNGVASVLLKAGTNSVLKVWSTGGVGLNAAVDPGALTFDFNGYNLKRIITVNANILRGDTIVATNGVFSFTGVTAANGLFQSTNTNPPFVYSSISGVSAGIATQHGNRVVTTDLNQIDLIAANGNITFSSTNASAIGVNLLLYANPTKTNVFDIGQNLAGAAIITWPAIGGGGTIGGAPTTISSNLTVNGLQTNQSEHVYSIGKGIAFVSGSNARAGTSILSGGFINVANTSIVTGDYILLTPVNDIELTAPSLTYFATNGVGFQITNKSLATSTNFVYWEIRHLY